jgi:hypothetical protein
MAIMPARGVGRSAADAGTPVKPTWLSSCASSGFSPERLACRTCHLISNALGAEHESSIACESCCSRALDIRPLDGTFRKYDTAALHVCRASATGGVNEWLEKAEKTWSKRGVSVVDDCSSMEGASFHLSLDTDADEAEPLRVPVHSWRHEDMSSFLKSILG